MGRKVWSSLLIGIALGIFITGTLYTYVFQQGAGEDQHRDPLESRENETPEKGETSEKSRESEQATAAVLEIEIEENHSMEELVYDLMVEGIISSKHQQQEIYEVLTYQNLDPGIREIPVYATTEEIIEAMINP